MAKKQTNRDSDWDNFDRRLFLVTFVGWFIFHLDQCFMTDTIATMRFF